ncbi:uncharacterized protein [Clytia hemisphaerica]|uniref:uncharacterized protein isoform X3 n=1 Tax=Clytia hemisphaerica TaxID=252671 RepID=UPI0034D64D7A
MKISFCTVTMFIWSVFVVFFGKIQVIFCNTSYEVKNFNTLALEESEEIKGPRSITECVMRCQRKTKEGFYTNDNKCFCHNGVVENQGDASGVSTKENKLNNEDKSIIRLYPYQADFTLDIWSDNDGGPTYEAYGEIKFNIGFFDFNQNVVMWHLWKPNYLNVLNGATHTITNTHIFQETNEFAHAGNLTALGTVWEWDDFGDDNNGSPHGDVFQMKDVLDESVKRRYDGYGAAHIDITLKITRL